MATTWGGFWQSNPIYGRKAGGFDANRYFGTPNSFDEIYWQQNPDQAYRRAVGQESRDDTHYNAWLGREQGWALQRFADASRGNPALLVSDYLPQAMQQLAERYTRLPGWQQGKNPAAWWAGRRL
jgi:hypothetical protein